MEPLKQFLKIGAGLGAMIGVSFLALPERPTLFAGGSDVRAQAPVEPASAGPALAEPAAPPPAQDIDSGDAASETELAGASDAAPAADPAPDAPAEPTDAQSGEGSPAGEVATVEETGPAAGQLHLQRLREQAAASRAGSPAEEPQADPVLAEPPAGVPVAGPSPAEFAFGEALPQDDPPAEMPEEDFAVPDAPSAGGGSGLASLTGPAERPQFRLLAAPEATDSGTILAGNQAIRLSGIVPVPSEAVCADGAACGTQAREAVQTWLAGRAVLCAVSPSATSRAVAPCLMGEEDVGEWIVANGWAEAEPGSRYVDAQERARAEGRGIWASGGR